MIKYVFEHNKENAQTISINIILYRKMGGGIGIKSDPIQPRKSDESRMSGKGVV